MKAIFSLFAIVSLGLFASYWLDENYGQIAGITAFVISSITALSVVMDQTK